MVELDLKPFVNALKLVEAVCLPITLNSVRYRRDVYLLVRHYKSFRSLFIHYYEWNFRVLLRNINYRIVRAYLLCSNELYRYKNKISVDENERNISLIGQK